MFCFGDSFDLYAAVADAYAGYWDSGLATGVTLVAGRFAGSQAFNTNGINIGPFVKSSGNNDAVHHIVCAFRQTAALSGTLLAQYFQLSDGATNQCCIVFRSDGAILLTSATPTGTVLATYTGAVSAANTWFAFEFEVVINNTTGSFTVRKNGNTGTPDFTATGLNTRPGTNNYANKISWGTSGGNVNAQQIDDFLWRSDPASVPWVGDIRCYTRMPASDQQKMFTPNAGTTNYTQVSEAHQDAGTTYVFDSNAGDADFYGIAPLAASPLSVVAVGTRMMAQKSDAGARTSAVQLKSGGVTVGSAPLALSTSWGWQYRHDLTDPATSVAWTPIGVNNVQIGPVVSS